MTRTAAWTHVGELGELRSRYERVLGRVQRPARLAGGEIGASPGWSGAPGRVRLALGFPDVYEVGISNQAIQILYHVAQTIPGVEVERVYLPWVDALAEMRHENIPLLTLESRTPARAAHLLGVSLQHELCYTNVLELLNISGIPLRANDRGEQDPLVIAGGPATANPLPLAPFFDAFAIGDGEELLVDVVLALAEARRAGLSREEQKRRLSALPGVLVSGSGRRVVRRVLRKLTGAPYPVACLTPLTPGVHDRAWVEVMRGCTRGCRFCQAGMWYRPVRERQAEEVVSLARAELLATGHEEVALGSLSSADYSSLTAVLESLMQDSPHARVSLPSLRVDSAAVRLAHLTSPGSGSVTLAPEAGSQRIRDVINKNVSTADILASVREALALGHTTVKLYFMIGLPTETDADVLAIADLCGQIRGLAEHMLGSKAQRLQLRASVTNFIPKPFTPFQWTGMADRHTLLARQRLLRSALRRLRVRLSLHDIDRSYLEAALARGGKELAGVIEGAWRKGARFDSWSEQWRPEAWQEAFQEAGLAAEALARREFRPEEPLPWEIVGGVVSRQFLRREWERALRGETTPDCRWDACSGCGVCRAGFSHNLAKPGRAPNAASSTPLAGLSGPSAGQASAFPTVAPSNALAPRTTAGATPSTCTRYLLTFAARGSARHLSHLDRLEVLRRAIRRTGCRLALSAGLRPKPLLSVALPLPVGFESSVEICEFVLEEPARPGFLERLNRALPSGLEALRVEVVGNGRPAAARVREVRYRVAIHLAGQEDGPPGLTATALRRAASLYTKCEEIAVERAKAGRTRRIDIRAFVQAIDVQEAQGEVFVEFATAVSPEGSIRPEDVVRALAQLAEERFAVSRIERVGIGLSSE